MFLSESDLNILREVLEEYTIAQCQSITVPPEVENYRFSARFEKFMQRLIRRQRKSYYNYIDTAVKRVASYAVILIICAFVTVFSVKALREPFINFVVETYEKFTSIFVQKDDIATAMNVDVEFEPMLPTYIPEGYELVEIENGKSSTIYNYRKLTSKLYIRQNKLQDWGWFIDTENTNYERVIINSFEGIYYANKGTNYIVYSNENYTYSIFGNISKEELIKIAESIK